MTAKLIRRHPHVFNKPVSGPSTEPDEPGPDNVVPDTTVAAVSPATSGDMTSREVLMQWDQIKREVEGRGADDPFADVPENLPGLLYARKVLRRAAPDEGSPPPKDPEARDRAERWLGDVLLELVTDFAPPGRGPGAGGPRSRRARARRSARSGGLESQPVPAARQCAAGRLFAWPRSNASKRGRSSTPGAIPRSRWTSPSPVARWAVRPSPPAPPRASSRPLSCATAAPNGWARA